MKKLILLAIVLAIFITGCIQTTPENGTTTPEPDEDSDFTTVGSVEDVRDYLQSAETSTGYWGEFGVAPMREITLDMAVQEGAPVPVGDSDAPKTGESAGTPSNTPSRVSETNVQVMGIDEPDIVKTDGENIYFSHQWRYYPFLREVCPDCREQETKIIRAFPPESLEIKHEIDKSGDLLLSDNNLVVIGYDEITGYDVTDTEKTWDIDLDSSLVTARLYNQSIYLITQNRINNYEPCPIRPLTTAEGPVEIRCQDIYHPIQPAPVDVTYNVMKLNPQTGEIEEATSFMGTSGSSVVYMSTNAIYITYSHYEDMVEFTYNFLQENDDLLPRSVMEKIERLKDYNISNRAKMVELDVILDQYSSSLSEEERIKFRNNYHNQMNDYREEHKRDLEKTGIAKIGLDLELKASGKVPGRVLNQFSLDEYHDHLRIATTVGRFSEATNDLYVLDEELDTVGSIKDYGEEERIYAVRFIGDTGYIVTFKETDPFFVVDLSDPQNPEIKGELKIPGYSSYLHPIDDDMILGLGKEDQDVKISLFDVSNPSNPEELDKYILDEYWSDVLQTHHAFLLDQKHGVFFLPAGNNGYIFSYEDELELEKAVSTPAVRAVYMDDYLYIIGAEIVVFDENTWEKVNELDVNS
ncbi:MAG: beta-propeller domain-containing protein [Archaeoglobaceae archaeon]